MARRVGVLLGWFGLALAGGYFSWLVLGFLPWLPSMVDVWGVPGLRWPTAVAVLGLLTAAIGFWDF